MLENMGKRLLGKEMSWMFNNFLQRHCINSSWLICRFMAIALRVHPYFSQIPSVHAAFFHYRRHIVEGIWSQTNGTINFS